MQAEHTHSPTPGPGVAGRSRNPSSNTHTDTVNPCQDWLGASGAHTQPNTPARSRGAQPKPEPKHTDPHRAPVPGAAACKWSTHTAQHPSQEWRGAAKTPSPNTHTHTARPCQEWLGASGARTRAHTQPNTPARSGWAQPKPEPKHTQPHRAPVPGVAVCKRSTHTAQHPSQEWRDAAETEPKHTHPHRAPVPGVAGCKRSTHTAQQPSQEWRGAAETRPQTHTPTPPTRARSGWVQAEHAQRRTPQPGVAGRSRNPSPNTQTHTAHPCQEWLGASGARTQPNSPARSGGAQPKPEPKHTHRHRAPVHRVAGWERSAHTAQHPGQEWRGAAET